MFYLAAIAIVVLMIACAIAVTFWILMEDDE